MGSPVGRSPKLLSDLQECLIDERNDARGLYCTDSMCGELELLTQIVDAQRYGVVCPFFCLNQL
ncbi:hypothetical protein QM312_35765, partial [Burkholderia cenocepacia]|uniref:hypothetical protein n=1 Tax=Burkholderia cenocepacia TaxID=95486 RepID=UPI0024B84195